MLCYIVTVFVLIVGMCQTRVEADFCFSWDKSGHISSFMDADGNVEPLCEIAIDDNVGLHENVINPAEILRDGRRLVMRLFWYVTAVLFLIQSVSVCQSTVVTETFSRKSLSAVILQYLHAQDGKKRLVLYFV